MSCETLDMGEFDEGGSVAFPVDFTDLDFGTSATPNTVKWTLRAANGTTVVNSRTEVDETPDTTVNIVLSGDDMAIGSNGLVRYVRVWGTFDSVTYGSDLPYQKEFSFKLRNLRTLAT